MNNYLIVYCHPSGESFNKSVLKNVTEELYDTGARVEICDLYSLGFDPVLSIDDLTRIGSGQTPPDILEQQAYIRQAERLVFIYPVWWASMPALLKGYIDRVFSAGFAYRHAEKGIERLLTDKQAIVITTAGTDEATAHREGTDEIIRKGIGTGILNFCGIEVIGHLILSGLTTADQDRRTAMLLQTRNFIHDLIISRS